MSLEHIANLNPFAKQENNQQQQQQDSGNPIPPKIPDTQSYLENNQQNKGASNSPDSPDKQGFDKWADLYETKKDKDGNPVQEKKEEEPSFSLASKGYTPDSIKKLSEKVSASLPDDEAMQKMFEEKDVNSFRDIINNSMRQAFQMAVMTNTMGVDDVLKETSNHMRKTSDSVARESLLANEVSEVIGEEFPDQYRNPDFRSSIDSVRQRIQAKYPDASPRKVASMLSEYVQDNFNLTPRSKQVEDQNRQSQNQENWLDL